MNTFHDPLLDLSNMAINHTQFERTIRNGQVRQHLRRVTLLGMFKRVWDNPITDYQLLDWNYSRYFYGGEGLVIMSSDVIIHGQSPILTIHDPPFGHDIVQAIDNS